MTVSDLERLYDYGYWANKKLLAVLTELTTEQFTPRGRRKLRFREEHSGSCAQRRMGLA